MLYGDIDEAICHHALYFAIWKKYGCLPERYNWKLNAPDVKFYPLRPEFIESTYLLYQATKNPFYLHVGKEILTSLNRKIIDFTTILLQTFKWYFIIIIFNKIFSEITNF